MKKKLRFIVPSLITFGILLVLFYYQGLYPFSANSIVQVDADYQFIPVLYRIYDFLHGNGNIIYDDIGLGNNIYISMVIQGSLFSPLSLLLYFTSRSNITCFFNILVIVKMCLISLTTYIYINKSYKVNEYYKIIFSILYTFSGWVLLNYFNIMWMDSLILFPLIVMYLDELLNKGKYVGYVITLSMSLMISYYMSYFILLFILFYSFVYIFLKLDKSKVKKTIFVLGVATVIAIMISSVSLLPCLYQTFNSSRLDSSSTSGLFNNFMNKSLYLMLSSVFLVIFGMLFFKYKKDRKNIYIYVILFILFSIGIFIEPINLAIHMGSYWSFPYRYSFITLFILVNGCLYYISKYDFKGYKRYELYRFIMFILLGIVLVYVNKLYYKDIVDSLIVLDFDDIDIYKNILIVFSIIIFMIVTSVSFSNKKYRYISFSIICLLQIFIYSGWSMYYNDGYYLSKNSNDINNNLDIVDSGFGRYKMGYTNYTPDYGFIYGVNTMDNWLHILPSSEIDTYRDLGYKNSDTCIRSYGGTIFSDWLFNVRYIIDNKILNDNMYTLLDSYNEYNLYEYRYSNGFGLVYNKNDSKIDNMDSFHMQNVMYRELFGKDNNIIKIDNYEYQVDGSVNISYDIDKLGFLYIDLDDNVDYIMVNDRYIDVNNVDYIIDLGMYEEDVIIEIVVDGSTNINFSLGFIEYDSIMNLSSNVSGVMRVDNGYDIEVTNKMDNSYLFLPINNISGLKAYVNDREVEIDSYIDNFVSIKLDEGINNIKIRYEMPMFKLGIIISIIGIICLILFNKLNVNEIMLNISYYIYIIVCLLFYLYYYAYAFIRYYRY